MNIETYKSPHEKMGDELMAPKNGPKGQTTGWRIGSKMEKVGTNPDRWVQSLWSIVIICRHRKKK